MSKSSITSPIGSTKNNVSKAAKRAAMASYGAIPGPIDSIAINHPDRGPPKSAKGRSNSQISFQVSSVINGAHAD